MKRTASIDKILKPLADTPFQAYLSNAVQVADILDWILSQVGVAEIWQTTIYFTDLYSWQKGAVENANKFFRQYTFKGTDFNLVKQDELDKIRYKINRRPREKLIFSTPNSEIYKNFV